jgi:hypothetical protein
LEGGTTVKPRYFAAVVRSGSKAEMFEGIGGGVIAPFSIRSEDLRLAHGFVNAGGLPPLLFEQVAAEAHRLGLVTSAASSTIISVADIDCSVPYPRVEPASTARDAIAAAWRAFGSCRGELV